MPGAVAPGWDHRAARVAPAVEMPSAWVDGVLSAWTAAARAAFAFDLAYVAWDGHAAAIVVGAVSAVGTAYAERVASAA
eukprot:scaffold117570_cov26-Tisochrysis_lutea.AAC.1